MTITQPHVIPNQDEAIRDALAGAFAMHRQTGDDDMWFGTEQVDIHIHREDAESPVRWYAYPVVPADNGADGLTTDTRQLLLSGEEPASNHNANGEGAMYSVKHERFDYITITPVLGQARGTGCFIVQRHPQEGDDEKGEWAVHWLRVDKAADLDSIRPFPSAKTNRHGSANAAAQWVKDYIAETHQALAAEV